jgi:hypothetical protein
VLKQSGHSEASTFRASSDDPSLIVPAAQVWNVRGRQAALLKRGEFRPREYKLSALGQAAKISPRVERTLKAAAPGGYELDAAGAHEFLREQAWALEQAGFGVMLPAWWTRKGTKLKLTARAVVESQKFQGGGRLSLEEIVKFDWRSRSATSASRSPNWRCSRGLSRRSSKCAASGSS